MAEASGAAVPAGAALGSPVGSVCWQIGGHRCELRSASAAVLELSRVVLAHGQEPTGAPASAPERLWRVDRHPSAQSAWRVLGPAADPMRAFATAADAVRTVEFAALQDLLATDRTAISLHAALVGRGQGGVLIVGPSESGKSTLATALWRQGLALCGDDVALVAADGASLSAVRRRVSLRHGSRALLGEALWQRIASTPSFMATDEGGLFHPHELAGSPPPTVDLAPAAIVVLARRGLMPPGPAERRAIPPAQALLALAPYTNVVRTEGMGAALQRLQPLLARTPVYDLGRGPLPAMVAAVERLLPAAPDAP